MIISLYAYNLVANDAGTFRGDGASTSVKYSELPASVVARYI